MAKPRSKEKEAQWRKHLATYEKSGLGVRAYCKREGLSENLFYAWRREIRLRDKESEKTSAPRFAPIEVLPSEGPRKLEADEIELCLGGDRALRFRSGCDADLLERVIQMSGGGGC